MEKKRMPQLVMDEVVLLVDAYFRMQNISSISLKKELVNELSDSMKRLPFFPDLKSEEGFRSPEGMQMCLANVGFIDPENNSKFGHGSQLQRKVFDYYRNNKELIRYVALAINRISKEKFDLDYSFADFMGGCLIGSYHTYLERTNKIVKFVREENRQLTNTICSVCGRDLSKHYEHAEELMEVHIGLSVQEYAKSLTITPSDSIILCPTCHKLAHSKPQLFDVNLLRVNIKG